MRNATCPMCNVEFQAKSRARVYCSSRCKDKGKPSASGLTCADCGRRMTRSRTSAAQGEARCRECRGSAIRYAAGADVPHGTVKRYRQGCRCDGCRSAKADSMRAYYQAYRDQHGKAWSTNYRRRQSKSLGYWPTRRSGIEPSVRVGVYERDGWTCQICLESVDPTAAPQSDWFPSLDHVKPVAAAPLADNSPGNLRLAHRWCNTTRADAKVSDAEIRVRAVARMMGGGVSSGWQEAVAAGAGGLR